MTEFIVAAATAFWLGILTSISPCPLATNIAAISYIGRHVGSTRRVMFAGLLYTLGRTAAYLGLAFVLVTTALSIPRVSMFLQRYVNMLLGPTLVLVGMLLVGLIQLNAGGGGVSERLRAAVDKLGIWGALLLGVVFALAFCPTSAALFFGSVMASLNAESTVALPLVYGVGTALPVLVFAVLIAVSARSVGRAFDTLSKVEWWARIATGWLILLIGVWLTLRVLLAEPGGSA